MTSPWPATAAHRPRESTSRCMRAASSLYRCAASRQPPRGERRWRGETERSQCEHARTRACLLTAVVQGRCAAGASSLHWYTAALTSRGSRTTRAAGAGARAAALALARCARRGCRLGSRARSGASKGLHRVVDLVATIIADLPRRSYGPQVRGAANVSTVFIPNSKLLGITLSTESSVQLGWPAGPTLPKATAPRPTSRGGGWIELERAPRARAAGADGQSHRAHPSESHALERPPSSRA